jgi:hypothetical protein
MIRHTVLVATLAAAAFAPATRADDAAPCVSPVARDAIVGQMLPLAQHTEQMIRHAIDAGAGPKDVYLMSRQWVLSERLHRRLVEPTADCAPAITAAKRDYMILGAVYAALDSGDAGMGVAKLEAPAARAELDRIKAILAGLDPQVTALGAASVSSTD